MPTIPPSYGAAAFIKRDGRTREARLIRKMRADLTKHVGGSPNAMQTALIERAVQLQFRLTLLDAQTVASGAVSGQKDKDYLVASGGLMRVLRELGIKPDRPAPAVPSLSDYLARRSAGS